MGVVCSSCCDDSDASGTPTTVDTINNRNTRTVRSTSNGPSNNTGHSINNGDQPEPLYGDCCQDPLAGPYASQNPYYYGSGRSGSPAHHRNSRNSRGGGPIHSGNINSGPTGDGYRRRARAPTNAPSGSYDEDSSASGNMSHSDSSAVPMRTKRRMSTEEEDSLVPLLGDTSQADTNRRPNQPAGGYTATTSSAAAAPQKSGSKVTSPTRGTVGGLPPPRRTHHAQASTTSNSNAQKGSLNTSTMPPPPPLNPASSAAMALRQYSLIAFLGSGTFGEVTLARHRSTGHLFAVKKISKARVRE
eukprot:PhF_6_TR35843/c0_g2_i1/m.52048